MECIYALELKCLSWGDIIVSVEFVYCSFKVETKIEAFYTGGKVQVQENISLSSHLKSNTIKNVQQYYSRQLKMHLKHGD